MADERTDPERRSGDFEAIKRTGGDSADSGEGRGKAADMGRKEMGPKLVTTGEEWRKGERGTT